MSCTVDACVLYGVDSYTLSIGVHSMLHLIFYGLYTTLRSNSPQTKYNAEKKLTYVSNPTPSLIISKEYFVHATSLDNLSK